MGRVRSLYLPSGCYAVAMRLTIELDREVDGRWIAEVPELNIQFYGDSKPDAIRRAQSVSRGALFSTAFALRIERPRQRASGHIRKRHRRLAHLRLSPEIRTSLPVLAPILQLFLQTLLLGDGAERR